MRSNGRRPSPKGASLKASTSRGRTRSARGEREVWASQVMGLFRRGFAASVDLFLLHLPAGIAGSVVLAFIIVTFERIGWSTPTDSLDQLTPWAIGCWVFTSLLVETFSTSRWGTTPGKRMVGLTVCAREGGAASRGKLLGRAAWKQVPFWTAALVWPPLVIVVSAIWVITWIRNKELPHDQFAATKVSNRA